jgi:pyridoxal kinase
LEEVAFTIAKIKDRSPKATYICDPVLGDNSHYYVPEELTAIYKQRLLPLATVITPNMFELQALSGCAISCFQDAVVASTILLSMGPKICFLTGLNISQSYTVLSNLISFYENTDGTLALDSSPSAAQCEIRVIRIDIAKIDGQFSGCGDLFSALVTGAVLHCRDVIYRRPVALCTILEAITETMSQVISLTASFKSKELCIIESGDIYRSYREYLRRLSYSSDLTLTLPPPSFSPFTASMAASNPAIIVRSAETPLSYLAVSGLVGIIFDMDGTLTEPGAIDFPAMYRRIGLKKDPLINDILKQVQLQLPTKEERENALRIIEEEELKGIEHMRLRPHLSELFDALQRARIRSALSTRNLEAALVDFTKKAALPPAALQPSLHRDSLNGINKPDPKVAEHIMSLWEVLPAQRMNVWFVGDSTDDMRCGRAAGCRTCLINAPHNTEVDSALVDLRVEDLLQLGRHLQLPGL